MPDSLLLIYQNPFYGLNNNFNFIQPREILKSLFNPIFNYC